MRKIPNPSDFKAAFCRPTYCNPKQNGGILIAKLIVAEKPSVAMSYAKVLGATNRQDGYLEGNGYLVSWCVGHLVELAPPNVYNAKYVKWSMQKIEVVVRITKDHCPPQEQTIFEWFDLMRNPTDALSRPDLEINLEHHRVFKHGTEVYMSRYEYGVLSLMAQHPGKLFTKEQIFEAVWHKDSESYLRAVTSTIGRIRQKIEDDKDHPRYIKTVSNIGYQFVPSSESVRLNRNL